MTEVYERSNDPNVKASELLAALTGDYDVVKLENCVIDGVVDIFFAGTPFDKAGRPLINKGLSCIGCTFTGVVNFHGAVFQQQAFFRRTTFRGDADFREAVFQQDAGFREATFQRGADFHEAVFEQNASFWKVTFHSTATFSQAVFHQHVNFHEATFHHTANFWRAMFHHIANFSSAEFRQGTDFNRGVFIGKADFIGARFACLASFDRVCYWGDTVGQWWRQKLLSHSLFWQQTPDGGECPRWLARKLLPDHAPPMRPTTATEFYLDSQNIDEVSNPFFKRYIADQQFIRAFKVRQRILSRFWRWSSDYGRSLGLWAFWSLFIALFFGGFYADISCPAFLKGTFIDDFFGWLKPEIRVSGATPENWLVPFYFSIVTFTTLGFGDVQPANAAGQAWITVEVIIGYLMLGGLISIFANKLARRS